MFLTIQSSAAIVAIIFIATCALLALFQGIFQIISAFIPVANPKHNGVDKNTFVSFHIATFNEPPTLVKNTMRSFKNLQGTKYELIVLDNNTKDKNIWKPLEEYNETLGDNFYFYHLDNVKGFKAGALNIISQKTNPEAKFISTVDADYEIEPHFLADGLSYFTDESIGFVQFPQAYKNVKPENIGIMLEYEHFFANYMNAANFFKSVSATGTLTFFRREALEKVGLYNLNSITEDADIGLRLTLAGYRGLYVDKTVGTGLMPYDLEAYKKQKYRWARGNARAIRNYFKDIFKSDTIKLVQKIGILSQLTAWLNLTLFLEIAVFISGFIVAFNPENMAARSVFEIASLGFVLFFVCKLISFWRTFNYKYKIGIIIKAFLIHVGMNWVYSTSLIDGLFQKSLYFERTNKFILPKMPSIIKNTGPEVVLAVFATFFYLLLSATNFLYALMFLVIAFSHILIFYVHAQINRTKPISAKIIAEMEESFNTSHS